MRFLVHALPCRSWLGVSIQRRHPLGTSAVMERIQHRWACVPMLVGPIHVAAVVMNPTMVSTAPRNHGSHGSTGESPRGALGSRRPICGVTERPRTIAAARSSEYRELRQAELTASPTASCGASGLPAWTAKFTSSVHRLKGARACPGPAGPRDRGPRSAGCGNWTLSRRVVGWKRRSGCAPTWPWMLSRWAPWTGSQRRPGHSRRRCELGQGRPVPRHQVHPAAGRDPRCRLRGVHPRQLRRCRGRASAASRSPPASTPTGSTLQTAREDRARPTAEHEDNHYRRIPAPTTISSLTQSRSAAEDRGRRSVRRWSFRQTHPSCCIDAPSFQIFVMWRILPSSKEMS